METADEKDAAEDEADKREYIAFQNKMEARRIAREIQTAHDTLASLRAEQEDVSEKSEIMSKVRAEGDRVKGGDAPGPRVEIKKSRANRPAVVTSVGEPETTWPTKAPRQAEDQKKMKSTKTGEGKATDSTVISKKTVVKSRTKRPTSATEPSRRTSGKTGAKSSDEESITEVLGPALVAGALGRKVGDARTATMIMGITECRVELLSTRQKAKLPVPAVPNNSAESNSVIECVGAYDVQLSLSATDQHVYLELPGDVTETITEVAIQAAERRKVLFGKVNSEPRRISLTSVAKRRDEVQSGAEAIGLTAKDKAPQANISGMGTDDAPVAPGEIATPSTYTELDRAARGSIIPDCIHELVHRAVVREAGKRKRKR